MPSSEENPSGEIRIYDRGVWARAPVVVGAQTEMPEPGTGTSVAKWDVSALSLSSDGGKADRLMVPIYVEALAT